MPNYTVRVWRPSIDAATPQEAAQLSVSTAAVAGDEFYVIENDLSGSVHYVAGSAHVLGVRIRRRRKFLMGRTLHRDRRQRE